MDSSKHRKKFLRRNQYLSNVKGTGYPQTLVIFDVETWILPFNDGREILPNRIGVMIVLLWDKKGNKYNRHIYKFHYAYQFLEVLFSLVRKNTSVYVLAHNVGFDIRALRLPEILEVLEIKSLPPIINNRIFMWNIYYKGGKIKFLDTANFGVESVEQLGVDLGYEKLSVDFENVSEDELIFYCQRDCEVLERFIISYIDFLKEHDLGGFKNTLASQSLTAYRHKFMDIPPYIHDYKRATELERLAYKGGRVECFRIGYYYSKYFYQLDVNSMYPYAMMSDELPIKLERRVRNISLKKLKRYMKKYYVIAAVKIKTNDNAYAYRTKNKLIFPVGEFTCVLHQCELEYALSMGHITNVLECTIYEKGSLFRNYVNFFYTEKRLATDSGNSSWRYIAKLFLNSLYGKFGQKEPHRFISDYTQFKGVSRIAGTVNEKLADYSEIYWFGTIYTEYKQGETSHSNAAIAGAITALARMRLYTLIRIAGKVNTYYVDTDSLIVNEVGYKRLKGFTSKDALGMLKLEKKTNRLWIWGNKDYMFGRYKKIKGVPKKAIRTSLDSWYYMQFVGFLTWMNKGGVDYPLRIPRTKQRRNKYDKGIIQPNGNVIPIVLENCYELSLELHLTSFHY